MFWFLMVLVVVGLGYIIFNIKTYQAIMEDARNRIENLEKQVENFEKNVQQAQRQNTELAELLKVEQENELALKNEIAFTVTQIKAAQKKETELEMNMYKQEFKRNKQRKY